MVRHMSEAELVRIMCDDRYKDSRLCGESKDYRQPEVKRNYLGKASTQQCYKTASVTQRRAPVTQITKSRTAKSRTTKSGATKSRTTKPKA